jgi:hypothetical protein
MFFNWAIKTKHRWLQKAIYWAQLPVVLSPAYVIIRTLTPLAKRVIPAHTSPLVIRSVGFVLPVLLYVGTASLCLFLLDRWFRYRAGDLLIASLAFCRDEVAAPELNLRPGALVVELHMGEVYNYAKYWPLRLTPTELVPFVFLDTYKGVLNLIEQVKSGRAPIDRTTPLMTTTVFLSAAHQIASVYVAEEIRRKKTLLYCLALALSLRVSPLSGRIPSPRGVYKRVYLPTQALLDHEPFFREEVARLSQLTQKIRQRKQRQRRIG